VDITIHSAARCVGIVEKERGNDMTNIKLEADYAPGTTTKWVKISISRDSHWQVRSSMYNDIEFLVFDAVKKDVKWGKAKK
jgi:hypothetical protein